jgi:hypothetical protein
MKRCSIASAPVGPRTGILLTQVWFGPGGQPLWHTTFGGSPMFSGHLSDCGVVFKLDRANRETVLYNFTGGADGCAPEARLVRDPAGDLYGTTTNGGYFGPPCGQYGAAWCSRSSMMTNAKAANRRGESLPCYATGAACETSRIVTRAKHQYA